MMFLQLRGHLKIFSNTIYSWLVLALALYCMLAKQTMLNTDKILLPVGGYRLVSEEDTVSHACAPAEGHVNTFTQQERSLSLKYFPRP